MCFSPVQCSIAVGIVAFIISSTASISNKSRRDMLEHIAVPLERISIVFLLQIKSIRELQNLKIQVFWSFVTYFQNHIRCKWCCSIFPFLIICSSCICRVIIYLIFQSSHPIVIATFQALLLCHRNWMKYVLLLYTPLASVSCTSTSCLFE